MILLTNDYMINERAIDVRSKLKKADNPSNIAEIFYKQLAHRVYDYIIRYSVNFKKVIEVDNYIKQNALEDELKRAMSEQALYILSNGDLSIMLPSGEFDYNTWRKMRMSEACVDVLKNIGFLRSVVGDQEQYYHQDSIQRQFDPTRNW